MGGAQGTVGRGFRATLFIVAALGAWAAPVAAQSPGTSPVASHDPNFTNFRITLSWDYPQNPAYEYFFWNGSTTVDGSLPVAWLRDRPLGNIGEQPTWQQRSQQAIEMFDSATCPEDQLTLDCGRCVETYESDQPARTDLWIESRTESQVVVKAQPVPDPWASDPQFRMSGCVGIGVLVAPWSYFTPMLITFALDESGATPVSVEWDLSSGYYYDPGFVLQIAPI
jgi:hypothetical protein